MILLRTALIKRNDDNLVNFETPAKKIEDSQPVKSFQRDTESVSTSNSSTLNIQPDAAPVATPKGTPPIVRSNGFTQMETPPANIYSPEAITSIVILIFVIICLSGCLVLNIIKLRKERQKKTFEHTPHDLNEESKEKAKLQTIEDQHESIESFNSENTSVYSQFTRRKSSNGYLNSIISAKYPSQSKFKSFL